MTTATNDEGSGKKGKQSDSYQAGTKQGAKNYKEGDKGRKDTRKPNDFYQVGTKHTDFTRAPTNDYQAGTKQSDSYQAGTKQGAKNYEEVGKGRQDTSSTNVKDTVERGGCRCTKATVSETVTIETVTITLPPQ